MKIATWNLNSINSRLSHLLEWCGANHPDVVCIQETKCVDESFPFQEIKDAGYASAFFGQKSYNGVAIISKFDMEGVQKGFPDDERDAQKRMIAATINGIRIVNTYVPNGAPIGSEKFSFKLDWLMKLRNYFEDECDLDSNVLLCGDFNVAPSENDVWNVPAWEGKIHFSRPERAAIHHLKKWGFIDVFRQINDDIKEFSWWDYRNWAFPKNHGLRIDHIWTTSVLAEKCIDCWIDKAPRKWEKPSDHAPVVAEFST